MKNLNRTCNLMWCLFFFIVLSFISFNSSAYPAPSDYLDTVQKIYIGYYQRPADPAGLIYWAGRLDSSSGNLNEIIEAFATSSESLALYGSITASSISTIVNDIYNAMFSRDAETAGRDYYVNGYNTGQFTAATIMLNVLYGAQGEDLQSINNKLTAANLFTRTIDPELDGSNFQATYQGESDAIAGRNYLSLYATSMKTPTQDETTAYIRENIADPGDPVLEGSSSILTAAVNLPQTGQITTYAAGDDGNLKKGIAWPNPRFTDNGNGTVTDNLTGHVWLKNANCFGDALWVDALSDVNALADGQCGLSDRSKAGDWRLPNRKELRSLVDYSQSNPALPAGHLFSNVTMQGAYWSSTTNAKNTLSVLTVHMATGDVIIDFKYNLPNYAWPVRAGGVAAPASIPKTYQTTSYASGDDGDLKKGVLWPEPRFTVDGTGLCVTDNLTDLMWVRTPESTTRTWAAALTYADGLNLCGYNDWRVPNVNELESLINAEEVDISAWLNTQGFSNILPEYYWSSSTSTNSTAFSWIVSMYMGNVDTSSKTSSRYIWLVRDAGEAPSKTPATGQTTCYDVSGNTIACADTGQDGNLNHGVSWPSPRFTDNGNGTIKDNLTGLIWLKKANCFTAQDWNSALNTANTLKTGECGLTDGSAAGDWRLPNRKELRSLIHYEKTNTAQWLNAQGFSDVQADGYWSSTTYVYGTIWAFVCSLLDGDVGCTNKTVEFLVWPVRAGGGMAADLPETGQQTCYNSAGAVISCTGTGQDGDMRAGVAWPEPRFIDYRDGTIKDMLTGLIWLKDANCFKIDKTWDKALSHVGNLAHGKCGLMDGSAAGDWRMPNINELENLFNAERQGIEYLNGLGFFNVQGTYWTSTTDTNNPATAITVVGDGVLQGVLKNTDPNSTWPVRDRKKSH